MMSGLTVRTAAIGAHGRADGLDRGSELLLWESYPPVENTTTRVTCIVAIATEIVTEFH
jgi:hypothetical protein